MPTFNDYTVKFYPRVSTAPEMWATDAVDASSHFDSQGTTINERFENSEWEFGPTVAGDCAVRLASPKGEYFGVSDTRSIFRMRGRNKAFVEIDDIYYGICRERETVDDRRNLKTRIQSSSIATVLQDIQVPSSAIVADIAVTDSITEMLLTAHQSFPTTYRSQFSPFGNPDIRLNHALYSAMRIANPSVLRDLSIFEAMGIILSANDGVMRVERNQVRILSRGINTGIGHETITNAGAFISPPKVTEGYERLYTAVRIQTGEDTDGRREAFVNSVPAATAYGARELTLDLSFLGNFARATEVGEYLLPRLSVPTKEVTVRVSRDIANNLGILSRVTLAASSSTGGLPGDVTFGLSQYPVDLVTPLYGDYYVAEINRYLGQGEAQLRLKEATAP